MRQIEELALWIGTARDARDIKNVLSLGIKTVIDLAVEETPIHPTRELVYLRFPLVDGTGNPTWLLRAALRMVEESIHLRVPTLRLEPGAVLMSLHNLGPIDVSPTLWQELLAVRGPSVNHKLTAFNY
jgi:hypothetical protein